MIKSGTVDSLYTMDGRSSIASYTWTNRPPYLSGLSEREWNEWLDLVSLPPTPRYCSPLKWIKASEDGRKRATTLPPLEREPTFHRKPKYFNQYELTVEEAADSHWKKKPEKISVEVDSRIKTHLKKQLANRFEKRLKKLEDAMLDEQGGRHGKDYNPWDGRADRHKHNSAEHRDIFNKYSETGAKSEPRKHSEKKSEKGLPNIGNKTETYRSEHTSDAQSQNGHSTKVQFPNINQNGLNGHQMNGEINGNIETENGDQLEDKTNDIVEDNREVFELTRLQTKFIENFRAMDVSPVPTPGLIRPATREQTRLSFDERMMKILAGQVHIRCPERNKTVRVYICSGFKDSEAERTVLLERVYPELRALCYLHGREFQMIDPHWGLQDALVDDHTLIDVCVSNIDKCMSDNLQAINAIILLTDRYGDTVLPSTMRLEEMEALISTVTIYTQSKKEEIREQLSELGYVEEEERTREDKEGSESKPENQTDGSAAQSDAVTTRSESQATTSVSQSETEAESHVSSTESSQPKQTSYRKEADIKREQALIKALKDKERELPDPSVLTTWYKLDENSVPTIYRLQNISSVMKDYGKGDYARRDIQKQNWLDIQQKLMKMIETFGVRLNPRDSLFKSVFDMELDHCLSEADDSSDQCIVVHREIRDIRSNLDDDGAEEYIDVSRDRPRKLTPDVTDRLQRLKEDVIPERISDQSVLTFDTNWSTGGVRVNGERSHQTYLDRMSKQVCDVMKRRLLESFKEEDHAENENIKLFDEISQHVIFAQERSRNFQGMKDSLQIIKSYVRSECEYVLAVHGSPGCGKSSVLAKAAKESHKWLKHCDPAVLFRSIGATKESTNIRSLLESLCVQLCVIFSNNPRDVPTDFTGLINDFTQRLSQASEDCPLVIYLDGLDRLKDDHNGRKLQWLPRSLPRYVHVIVSTLTHEKFECMPSLKTILGDKDMFLEIPELKEFDAVVIFHHWCNVHNHTVTEEQYDAILQTFNKCPSPLFLKLLFLESLTWQSHSIINQSKLPDTVKKIAAVKYGQLEIKYGECFVRRALGYLTAARNGITDHEMLDVLALDDALTSEMASAYRLNRRRVPTSLWLRLRHEMKDYIVEGNADGVKTLQWAHLHFYEAAKERYLDQRDKAPSYHRTLSELFLGIWETKPKPYPGNDKGALRYVAPQPLYWEPKDATKDGSQRVYNLRKINELPYHLLRSNQIQLYKTETMCNFEWVLAKLCGTSLRNLVEEYHIGLETDPTDLDLKLLSDTLELSANAVLRDPRQLAGQVVGRLQGIINRDVPAAPGDPPKYPYLHSFLAQAKTTSIPALIPSIGCLTEPGGILYDLLSGHTKPITAVTTTTDAQRALTASEDNTMKVWDLKSGKVTATFDDFGACVTKLRTASNNNFVISVEGSILRVWTMRTKECRLVVDQFLDPPVISIAGDTGKLLVALFDGVNILRTWDLDEGMKFVCESKIEDDSVYSDNSVILSPNSYGDYVLHAFRGNNCATIQHAKTGKVIHKLQCNDSSSSIVALQITRDYMVLACRQHYMKLHEIHQLELFDAKKGKYLRSIRGCTQDIITELHTNLVGSHAIAVCASESSNSSNIMIWNLETEDHKHLAKHSGISTVSACADFRYCLTAQKGDKTLKIWNISKHINQSMPKMKKSLGVAEIYPMIDNPRYAIARQVNHGPISIWNVAKAKCLANAVRIERGLSESSDIVLIRNCLVVILTEKGLKDSRPVFKTILLYDLRSKRYIKKITGCFIVPSPAHEYVLLDDDTLLGPADTRNHFIIWKLTTGRELFRIRPKFRDIDPMGRINETELEQSVKLRASTAKLTPWDRRTESTSAKQRRRDRDREEEKKLLEELQKEKQNGIEQYIISGDLKIVVASFFAHHLAVLNLETKMHIQTLENEHSMLFLHVAALNYDGSSLVHANYDESTKISYVTLWDTNTGQVRKRLKNETDVLSIAITDDGSRVVFGRANKELRIWDPYKSGPGAMKKVKGYDSLEFGVDSKIFILDKGQKAVVFAWDISLWDLEHGILLAAFTPDTRIECLNVVMNGQLITMGVHEFPELVVFKMMGKGTQQFVDTEHEDLFGETTGDTSDEDEDEEDEV